MHSIASLVLKNSPPRLELVAREGSKYPAGVEFPSLDEVEATLREWNKTTQDIPDDQYLVFKAQRAKFSATKSTAGELDVYLDIRMTDGPGQMIRTKILDRQGHPVGEYQAERIGEPGLEEHAERDFLYVACQASRHKGGRVVHALEVELKDGIWYRVDAADIEGEAWDEAVVGEELIILG